LGSIHSNPADGREIFSRNLVADSPRNPTGESGSLVGMRLRAVLEIAAVDFAATVAAVVLCRAGWRGNSDWPAIGTTGEHRVGMTGCNNASSDAQDERAVHNASANSGECGAKHLAPRSGEHTLREGPREVLLPLVKSRSEGRTSLRGDFTRPTSSRVIQREQQSENDQNRGSRIAVSADQHRQLVEVRPRATLVVQRVPRQEPGNQKNRIRL